MKIFGLIIVLFGLFNSAIAQTDTSFITIKEQKKLNSFNLDLGNYNFMDSTINLELKSILKYNQKSKRRKATAITLVGMGVYSVVIGSALLSRNEPISSIFGGALIFGGVVMYGGISIPFFISSKKKKFETEEKIKSINNM